MAESGIYQRTQLHDNKFHKEIVSSLEKRGKEKSSIESQLNQFKQIKNTYSHQNNYNINYFDLRIEHIQLSIKCLLIGSCIAIVYVIAEILYFKINLHFIRKIKLVNLI